MSFEYLLPAVELLGRQVQLPVTDRDTLTWISLRNHVADERYVAWSKGLLADCPELLVWCLARVDQAGLDESMPLEQIAGELLAAIGSQTQPPHELIARRFADGGKRKYRKTLLRLFDPDYRHAYNIDRMRRKLSRLVANSLQQPVTQVESWLERLQLDHDFWARLSLAARNQDVDHVQIESLLTGQSQDVAAGEDFELRLQQEKLASMKQLAYGASHEINNPLANIASRAQTLMLDENDPDRRLRLAKINEQAFRAHEMIADMMLFAHPPRPDLAEADAAAIARQVIDEIQPLAEAQGTQLEFLTTSIPAISMDATQVAVALRALLQNSLESLAQDGKVTIQLQSTNDSSMVTYSITDDGPGIPADKIRHIFDPFYSGREAGRGLGFGLSKAWRIAELHGGEITAENLAPGGVRFCLRIPYRNAA